MNRLSLRLPRTNPAQTDWLRAPVPEPAPAPKRVTVPAVDAERLGRLSDRVAALMKDGAWRTLEEIREKCGGRIPALQRQ